MLSVVEACAAVLKEVKNTMAGHSEDQSATFVVPSTWNKAQLAALRFESAFHPQCRVVLEKTQTMPPLLKMLSDAASLAGLSVHGTVTEPVAAVLAYGLGDGQTQVNKNVVVVDVGGTQVCCRVSSTMVDVFF
jgi:molecular chaperone DnaK (HSP70)